MAAIQQPVAIKAMMCDAEVVALLISVAIKMKSLSVIHESQRLLYFRKHPVLPGLAAAYCQSQKVCALPMKSPGILTNARALFVFRMSPYCSSELTYSMSL
jgi:hypothetical protein